MRGRSASTSERRVRQGVRGPWIYVALFALAVLGWSSGSVFSIDRWKEKRSLPPVQTTGPSLDSLNRALHRADKFIDGLYRPVGARIAVTSEYYGAPIRAYFPRQHEWVLAGEDSRAVVSRTESRFSTERFTASLKPAAKGGGQLVDVRIRWGYRQPWNRVTVANRGADAAIGPAVIYLGDWRLGRFTSGNVGAEQTLILRNAYRAVLRSFRYTARHGVQEAQNYYRYEGNRGRFHRLAELLRAYGFGLSYDLTAPIWGQGAQYGDGMPYDVNERGFSAYHDCKVELPATEAAYPYRSKICSISRHLYVALSRRDTLVPAAQAIHILNKYGDPLHTYQGGPPQTGLPTVVNPHAAAVASVNPVEVAGWLEAKFRRNGVGVPRCTLYSCDRSASGVRTFQFGALETLLGYRYGDAISRRYADAAAASMLRAQVGASGIVATDQGRYYRPAARGGFLLGWDRSYHEVLTKSLPSRLADTFEMPPEYTGVIASNSETTLTAYAFLSLYRCLRYSVGCSPQTR